MYRGLTFKNIHSSSFGLAMRSRRRQMLPSNANVHVDVPGRDGSLFVSSSVRDRFIEVEFFYIGDMRNRRLKARELAAWLYSRKRERLIFDDEPDKFYLAEVSQEINLEDSFSTSEFTVVFRCEPFAYGEEQEETFVDDVVTVENEGTIEAFPRFITTFTNAANEWKVSLGNKFVRVLRSFEVGDVLEVDCSTGKISINGTNNISYLDWQNSEFFALLPGENDLTVEPSGVAETTIKYNPRWL